MIDEEIFLSSGDRNGVVGPEKSEKNIFLTIIKIVLILALAGAAFKAYDILWLRHRYLITAYCDCPVCINVPAFRDGKFASRHPVYWGGVAADKSIPFGSNVELVPVTPRDWFAIWKFLGNRRQFIVEDRGGKIHSRHIDLFFSGAQGGHQAALKWGTRRMRVRINGRLMD